MIISGNDFKSVSTKYFKILNTFLATNFGNLSNSLKLKIYLKDCTLKLI